MSYTMHIQTKHVVEYKDSGKLKFQNINLKNLLYDLNVGVYDNSDDAMHFEIPKADLIEAINVLQDIGTNNPQNDIEAEDILADLDDLGKTPQDIIILFNWMLDNAAPDHDVVFVDFF